MNGFTFDSPVTVRDGEFVREVGSVWDAIEFMEEWPVRARGVIYETASDACYAAHDGRKPVETARRAFIVWARRAGVLVDAEVAPAWMVEPKTGSSGALV